MTADTERPTLTIDGDHDAPEWALLQRRLVESMNDAAEVLLEEYTHPDGTLVWRDEWPGMDGSDDAYEPFVNWPLFYALGGSERVHELARRQWEAVTWQFTEYGQVHREFDAYYDWMHHGESYINFYYFGLADPTAFRFRQRSINFAEMYTGDDPLAQNWDPERKLIRSPINGSRGPQFEITPEDWSTHRWVLSSFGLPAPYEDIPGVEGEGADWTDDEVFREILDRMNERMMAGDVPLNLNATSLVADAYMYTGEDRFRDWVLEYLDAWRARTAENGGITPDNVGPSGEIGETNDGHWWGGYYGYRWPHGAVTVVEPLIVAGTNAVALTRGDGDQLDLARSQLDALWERGEERDGTWQVPTRHTTADGWTDFEPVGQGGYAITADLPIHLWTVSKSDADAERVERFVEASTVDAGPGQLSSWYRYVTGDRPGYPARKLAHDLDAVRDTLRQIRTDDTDPADWYIQKWVGQNPVVTEGLVQLTLGAPENMYHGGLLHCPIRHYDADAERPGLPPDVAALVERVTGDAVEVRFANLNPSAARTVVVQAGGFATHEFDGTAVAGGEERPDVDGRWVAVELEPGAGGRVELGLDRYRHLPSYETPWADPADVGRIRDRSARDDDDMAQLDRDDFVGL